MALIEMHNLAHSYAPDASEVNFALEPMHLQWQDGGAYALLGPSGCGKTTLLNIISGLLRPSHGRVLFDGRDVTELPTERRNIAQVFQFPVIYDTMTVYQNLAFPLRNRRMSDTEIRARVHEIAELLELEGDLNRRASQLTADAKQIISLGRGLVRKDVNAILFDEPLTVIDPHLKWLLRRKLKQIHKDLRISMIYVTHDQVEALTFADQVVVMNDGRIMQLGTPQELFEHPLHTFVGYFVGSPGMNLMPATVEGGHLYVDGQVIPLPADLLATVAGAAGDITLGIRPEFVQLTDTDSPGAIRSSVQNVEDHGKYKLVTARLGKHAIKVKVPEEQEIVGGPRYLSFPPEFTRLYVDGRVVNDQAEGVHA